MKLNCTCKHQAQDRLHGHGVRVFNPTTKKLKDKQEFRCTVCGTTKPIKE